MGEQPGVLRHLRRIGRGARFPSRFQFRDLAQGIGADLGFNLAVERKLQKLNQELFFEGTGDFEDGGESVGFVSLARESLISVKDGALVPGADAGGVGLTETGARAKKSAAFPTNLAAKSLSPKRSGRALGDRPRRLYDGRRCN